MAENYRVIIIDDEELARELIKKYIYSNEKFTVIAECADGFEGVKKINELKPDLIFLDIQMPRLTGFEMLEILEFHPKIIFTTAYEEYAIKAFELHAVDYLLKPFSLDRFYQALDKVKVDLEKSQTSDSEVVNRLMESPFKKGLNRIVVKSGRNIKVIPIDDIKYLEAQDDYVMIYTMDGKFLKQQTMSYYEQALDPTNFVRTHRSYIVKIDQIKQIEPYEKEVYIARLKTGELVKISKSGYKRIRELM
jgi:two-component system, LytTR family, response regulator